MGHGKKHTMPVLWGFLPSPVLLQKVLCALCVSGSRSRSWSWVWIFTWVTFLFFFFFSKINFVLLAVCPLSLLLSPLPLSFLKPLCLKSVLYSDSLLLRALLAFWIAHEFSCNSPLILPFGLSHCSISCLSCLKKLESFDHSKIILILVDSSSSFWVIGVFVCLCLCVRQRESETQREKETERQTNRGERGELSQLCGIHLSHLQFS